MHRAKIKKPPPFPFVLEMLEPLNPVTKPMFGCLAVYSGEKILFILRESADHTHDNGVWIATTPEHHAALRAVIPTARSIRVLNDGKGETGWQNIPVDDPDFESHVELACKLALRGDARIGKVPQRKKTQRKRKK